MKAVYNCGRILGLCAVITMAGCSDTSDTPSGQPTSVPQASSHTVDTIAYHFDEDESSDWQKSSGYKNGDDLFDCTWRSDRIRFEDGIMGLSAGKDPDGSVPPYGCAEYKTKAVHSYGKYEVRMKPAAVPGVISSFFLYTGPSFGTVWDEIDIEFLGDKPDKVQFNYFTNGSGKHELMVDLGYDASKEFHTYAFDWQPDSIKWYVDGVLKGTSTENLPVTPAKLMMNVWNTKGVDQWAGRYEGKEAEALYDWVKITPDLKKLEATITP